MLEMTTDVLQNAVHDPSEFTIDEIVLVLEYCDELYNEDGASPLSDAEYDELRRYVELADPANVYLIGVGSNVRGGKVQLPYPMPGLDQKHEGETSKWVEKHDLQKHMFALWWKLDGQSIELIYSRKDGTFQSAFTRGNDKEGADVTRHIRAIIANNKRISKIPAIVGADIDDTVAIRAEVIMKDETFDDLKEQGLLMDRKGMPYKTARNFVPGQMNSEVASDVFYEHIDIVAFSVINPRMNEDKTNQFLNDAGFDVAGVNMLCGADLNDDDLSTLLTSYHELSPWALDGIVIGVNGIKTQNELQKTRKGSSLSPVGKIKFKVGQDDNVAIAEVVQIHRKASKHGVINPRVEIVPVELVGVTITFATGFNERFIKVNNIGPGAKLKIVRSGDVIPKIIEVVEPAPNGYEAPDPAIIGAYHWSTPNSKGDQIDIILDNADTNDTVIMERLLHFFVKLKVDMAKEGAVRKLYEAGYNNIVDIVKLPRSTFVSLIGTNGGKLYDSMVNRLNPVPLEVIAAASGCYGFGIGERKLRIIVNEYNRLDNLSLNDIIKLEGFSDKSAQKVYDATNTFMQFRTNIDDYFTLDEPKEEIVGGKLEGQIVVFTGYRDKEAQEKIQQLGGVIGNSVSGKTTLVVTKDPTSNSGKIKKAKDKGIKVIGPDELAIMLD